MPSLLLFGRKSIFAGDDLPPTAIVNIFVRVVELFVFLLPVLVHMCHESNYFLELSDIVYSEKNNIDDGGSNSSDNEYAKIFKLMDYLFGYNHLMYTDPSCDEKSHYFPLFIFIYIFLSIIHFISSSIVEFMIYKVAIIGTPTQPQLRNPKLSKIIEKKWVLLSIASNIIILTFGLTSVLVYRRRYYDCRDEKIDSIQDDDVRTEMIMKGNDFSTIFGQQVWWILLLFLLTAQSVELFVASVSLISLLFKEQDVYSPQSFTTYTSENQYHQDFILDRVAYNEHHEFTEEMWDERCRSFCKCAAFSTCFLFGGQDLVKDVAGEFGDISRALADYFEDGGVLDLAPSDIAVGFIMLQRIQRQRLLIAQKNVLNEMKNLHENKSKVLDFVTGSDRCLVSTSTNRLQFLSDSNTTSFVSAVDELSESGIQSSPTSSTLPHFLFLRDVGDGLHHTFVPTHDHTSLILRVSPSHGLTSEEQTRKVLSRDNELDRLTIAEGARFARHALSIYTWVLIVYMYPISGPFRLMKGFFSNMCLQKQKDKRYSLVDHDCDNSVLGDNCFHIHKNGLLAHSGIDESDLIYADFNNTCNQMPYCIVIDHKWKSIVVSIRGTLSLEDCVVDVILEPDSLESLGNEFNFDGVNQYCHSGVLACAKYIFNDLQRHGILDKLLNENDLYSHYTLRLTGHSLGAGCAILIGLMLRRRFQNLRVISISPPGGFITEKLAIECQDFVTTFILDSELVPRLSLKTMENLRDEILDLIGKIKVPKTEIVKSYFMKACSNKGVEDDLDYLIDSNSKLIHSDESNPSNTTFARQLEKFKQIQKERKERRGEIRKINLYPPGRIVHLVKTDEIESCSHLVANCLTCGTTNAGSLYTPVWATNYDFNEIVVSPTMATDHFPNRICLELERVADSFGLDTTIGSSERDREDACRARGEVTSSTNRVNLF